MRILAIDPGPLQSAYVVWEGARCVESDIVPNASLRTVLLIGAYDFMAIEMVACYGMAVGREVFETCLWIGRFAEVSKHEAKLVYRRDVKIHFCHSARAKDANIRQAIIDLFGGKDAAIGKKATQGPLYGIKSHLWSALAIALHVRDGFLQNPPAFL